jgi:hypothetical protein
MLILKNKKYFKIFLNKIYIKYYSFKHATNRPRRLDFLGEMTLTMAL